MTRKFAIKTVMHTCVIAVLYPGPSRASGIYIPEMSNVSESSYAGAGMVARANDAGTVFTNPAGMTRFDDTAAIAGATFVYIHGPIDLNEEKTTVEGNARTVKTFVPAGSAAYLYSVSDRLKLGVSLGNNFGLALDWNADWAGRYSTVKIALLAPQLQPTVAYKVNDWLSVGGGAALTMGYLYDKMRVDPVLPNRPDGKLRISDADFAVQGNFGIMIEPSERTRIGLRYLTETDLNFKDSPDVSGLLVNPNTPRLDLSMKMPQSVMAGIHHQLNSDWAVLGSLGWEEWSQLGKPKVELVDVTPSVRVDAGFRDTWHFGVGTEYQYKPKWLLTAGVTYDTSMMTDATGPIDLPMAALYRYGAGFKYAAREDLTLGAGLTWLYEGSVPFKESGGVAGKYKNVSITFLSFYASWH
ncbi:OmpP1/FadL family transporter [Pseudomonadota bacterium]